MDGRDGLAGLRLKTRGTARSWNAWGSGHDLRVHGGAARPRWRFGASAPQELWEPTAAQLNRLELKRGIAANKTAG